MHRVFSIFAVIVANAAGLVVACGPARSLSDKEILGIAYAREAAAPPSNARVAWRYRFDSDAGAFAGAFLGVIASGGDDRLLVLRSASENAVLDGVRGEGAANWRVALRLEFAAPLRSRAGPGNGNPAAGLRKPRILYRGTAQGGLLGVGIIPVRGFAGGETLLWIQYVGESGPALFLYRASGRQRSMQRVFDSQLRPSEGTGFLYFNGFEMQNCPTGSRICPAFSYSASLTRGEDSQGTGGGPCAGVALRVENLAPDPGPFWLVAAFLNREGARDPSVDLRTAPTRADCRSAAAGEFRCHIAAGGGSAACFERRRAEQDARAGFVRIAAGAGARTLLPPRASIRRTVAVPGGRAYLVADLWSSGEVPGLGGFDESD